MATLIPPPSKKQKIRTAKEAQEAQQQGPGVVVQFRNAIDQSSLGPPVTLGSDTNVSLLEGLVNKLRTSVPRKDKDENDDDDDPVPFSFNVVMRQKKAAAEDKIEEEQKGEEEEEISVPVIESIRASFTKAGKEVDVERVIVVDCEPEAVFKVRPVTRCSSTLSGHESSILCASFSPTGTWLATGSGDNCARIWNLDTETPRFNLVGHTGWLLCVEWDGMESRLATGSMDNMVRLWDIKTGKNIGDALRGHTKWITSLAWEPIHINAHPRLASSSKDGTVRVWDASKTRHLCFALGSHTASVNVVRWGGEGIIYTGSSDRTIKLWDASDGKLIRTLSEHAHWVNTIALNTDFLLRTGPFDHQSTGNASSTLSPEEAQEKAKARYANLFKTERFAGEQIVSGSDDHTLFLWPPIPSKYASSIQTDGNEATNSMKKPVARMTGHQRQVNHVAFSPNGRMVASASFDKSVRLWDGKTGKFIATLRGHVGAVYRLSWSSDSRMLVSASKDSTLKIWNLRTNKIRIDLPGHADEVFCVDFVADKIASGGKDKKLKIWRH